MRGPGAVIGFRALGPGKHVPGKRNAKRRAQRRKRAFGVGADRFRRDDRGGLASQVGDLIEKLGLLQKADVGQRGRLAFLGIAGNDAGGVADQESVGQAPEEATVKGGDHVQRHVLLIPERLAFRDRAKAKLCHTGGVGFASRDDFGGHRMINAGGVQIGGVEGFVPHRAIATGGKGIHHRGRQVPGAGPHGNADWCCGHGSRFAAWVSRAWVRASGVQWAARA